MWKCSVMLPLRLERHQWGNLLLSSPRHSIICNDEHTGRPEIDSNLIVSVILRILWNFFFYVGGGRGCYGYRQFARWMRRRRRTFHCWPPWRFHRRSACRDCWVDASSCGDSGRSRRRSCRSSRCYSILNPSRQRRRHAKKASRKFIQPIKSKGAEQISEIQSEWINKSISGGNWRSFCGCRCGWTRGRRRGWRRWPHDPWTPCRTRAARAGQAAAVRVESACRAARIHADDIMQYAMNLM